MAGLISGVLIYQVALIISGFTVTSRQSLQQQQDLIEELRQENKELAESLFLPRDPGLLPYEKAELPYDGDGDASEEVQAARQVAMADRQFLMVTFGANWCRDCRVLHQTLNSAEVRQYTEDLFSFINVDVGKFNQNRHVAEELGVELSRGIPVAIFFDPQGRMIGTTNEGQLEPARRYTSKQILKFMRSIAERSRVSQPDGID